MKAMAYKTLSTVIDDFFSVRDGLHAPLTRQFIIKMPILHRIGQSKQVRRSDASSLLPRRRRVLDPALPALDLPRRHEGALTSPAVADPRSARTSSARRSRARRRRTRTRRRARWSLARIARCVSRCNRVPRRRARMCVRAQRGYDRAATDLLADPAPSSCSPLARERL